MPTEAKREAVAELREELAAARTLIVSEYRGLNVKEIAEIRRALSKQDVKYRVVKNRLLKIAAEDTVGSALNPLLTGPTAIAFGMPRAVSRVPSSGSTATSTSGPEPSPTSSPLNSIGASSFSPSPMTTVPRIATVSSMSRIASTAA